MTARPRLFADLHCHPTLYSFNRMRHTDDERDATRFHPWRVMPSDGAKMAASAHASAYSQCNLAQLTAGRVRLVFASFTPIEKGFLQESSEDGRHPFVLEALRVASGATLLMTGIHIARGDRKSAAKEAGRILRNHGPLRELLVRRAVHYSADHVKFMLSRRYDYWEELLAEYRFLQAADGKRGTATCQRLQGGRMVDEPVEGAYHLIRDVEQLRHVIEGDGAELAMVLTIEGGHVLSVGSDSEPLDEATIFDRLAQLKRWPHPLFLLTVAHHFDNGICGHAHTIPDIGGAAIDQTRRLGEGLEERADLGMRVFRECLDLDEDLRDRGGRRILLDVKHLSPRTRQQYYDRIVRPYNAHNATLPAADRERFPPIPVVGSHMGYAGVPTLQQLVDDAEREDDHWLAGGYYAWGMNLADEDVHMLHDSEGLAGIIFDRRVVGAAPGLKIAPEQWPDLLWRQITGMVDVVMLDDRRSPEDKVRIWDRLCIGTDFDGFMHPLPPYPTVLEFDAMAEDLARRLHQHRHTRMIEQVGADAIVEKFAWRNAYDFTLRHLPAAAGG
jgi:hypothetical protein